MTGRRAAMPRGELMVVLDGEKIVRLRIAKGYGSQRVLADATRAIDPEATGISPRLVWDAEHGKSVSHRTHLLIANALAVNPEELVAVRRATAARPLRAMLLEGKSPLYVGTAIVASVVFVVLSMAPMRRPVVDRVVRAASLPLPHLFDDLRAQTKLASNTTLSHDLLCRNITIQPGVILDTDGHDIFCTGRFRNDGEIVTGYSGFQDYPASYGGAGGVGTVCDPRRAVRGFTTLESADAITKHGGSIKIPALSPILLRRWYSVGFRHLLAGAAGGGTSARAGRVGGPGAYGVYIQARQIDAGLIRAQGLEACNDWSECGSTAGGGGGGGAIILAFGSGGFVPGRYVIGGGSGAMRPCGKGENGEGGSVSVYSFGRSRPIMPLSGAYPSSKVISPMRISSVTFTKRGTTYDVTIMGSGLGSAPHLGDRETLHRFRIANSTERFEAGYVGDRIPLNYLSWSPHRVVISGFHAYPGDCVELGVWNPTTMQAVAWGGNVPPIPKDTPHISSADISASGEVTILGSGFGKAPARVPFSTNQNLVDLSDLAFHSTEHGPSILYTIGGAWSTTRLLVDYWSNTKIEIVGTEGPYGHRGMRIEPGDPVSLEVQNIWSKSATGWGGVAN